MHGVHHVCDLASKIAVAEDFYAAHAAPARFQVCPACPADLDVELSLRGYQWSSFVSLQAATTGNVARHLQAPRLRVDLTEHPDAEWFHLLMAAQGLDADPAEWRLLERIDRPSAFATAFISGRAVAVGRAVADTGWAGVFGMATLPDARDQGAGSAVLATLADWAGSQGAAHMYLQVTRNSTAALRLYRRAGFEAACTYHYRTALNRR